MVFQASSLCGLSFCAVAKPSFAFRVRIVELPVSKWSGDAMEARTFLLRKFSRHLDDFALGS